MKRNAIILAAGKGTRMRSKLYKVLHQVCGKTMVEHVVGQLEKANIDNIITVVGFGADRVEEVIGNRTKFALQDQQLGTGHAVMQTKKLLADEDGETIVVSGDTPLFTADTFKKLFEYHEQRHAAATILTSVAPDPTGYGRIIRNEVGIVERIVEQKDATPEEQEIHEINTGVYCFDNKKLFAALKNINNDNAQGEYYLTDVIEILKRDQEVVTAYKMADFDESMGVNDRVALARANKLMRKRINTQLMKSGVTMLDPETTYIDDGVKIGQDTVIEGGVVIKGKTTIGNDCYISAHSRIEDSTIHDGVTITSSTLQNAEMHDGSDIGPNSHLRPDAEIGKNVHIGNFCEVKKAFIGEGTKVGHLTYIGNATLGKNINVGCGVVFVNYDGKNKHHTNVGDHAFIGSNSNLVAPVNLAANAFVAAGSTITDNVDEYDMAIARARQTNKENYAKKLPW
ncbi:MAG: bifunctional UDP-N-acetylglucosamine diphosphorylase/glucosamine-1-phosphate N-acetyltransferase GlmU [Limosilactobacillus sp.]|uniref:bifunctional UDP-N-acetylglucosamine diphosphorylase/glucosamine-1-phosphate N-acetyltransferase GlmU n=1 Tax=Limosilactobacillus sp. TaxID=2773925 RepID=UPI0025C5AF1A|nr:bifunctional UDP-N-acetylglucosamine diphosphorylase/glucosamine-1-phosphate N-acetyltransferase GlmU [Limosilactobacillus sp.]MCI1974697.1 bifunctional UDP-N-acetylglucosamine diphosphorylase/glucosamine-1-phosphate N-acetyltransferase GlmU [Limosilactobacillus sp.]MCI2030891.1 bifunctional UDP-N-acetylglucosamine diphosphorylase/glucosamine-1-phosphate N-acetyltransferase GlmU [Limosilactobacillus sp.]